MKKIYLIFTVFLLLFSCGKKDIAPKNEIGVVKDSVGKTSLPPKEVDDSDCIFDNNPKKLTEEWLKNSGLNKFTWDAKNNRAMVIQNKDTLYIYKGGCNHLTTFVEIRMQSQYNDIFDNRILKKIDSIACKFKFDNYRGKLATNQFVKTKLKNDNSFILEFEDDNPEDNLILEGIQLEQINNSLRVIISEYYN